MSLDKKILERIEKENLGIRPLWFFTVKNFVFGLGILLLSISGSLSLALLFEIIKRQGKVSFIWIALLVFFLFGGYWLATKMSSLYKIRFVPIISILFFVSLSFGYMTFASGEAEEIEEELEEIPIYSMMMPISREITIDEVKEKYKYYHRNIRIEEKKQNWNNDGYKKERNRSFYSIEHKKNFSKKHYDYKSENDTRKNEQDVNMSGDEKK